MRLASSVIDALEKCDGRDLARGPQWRRILHFRFHSPWAFPFDCPLLGGGNEYPT